MSFDLKMVDGDIEYAPGGDFSLIANRDKLKQDIQKILLTKIGTDPGSAQYGSDIYSIMGRRMSADLSQSVVAKSVKQAIDLLQSLEFVQSTYQTVNYDEVVGSIEALSVVRPSLNSLRIELAVITVSGLRIIFVRDIGEEG